MPLNTENFWQGKSSKFAPHAQKVGLNHPVQDDDVVSSERLVFDQCRNTETP